MKYLIFLFACLFMVSCVDSTTEADLIIQQAHQDKYKILVSETSTFKYESIQKFYTYHYYESQKYVSHITYNDDGEYGIDDFRYLEQELMNYLIIPEKFGDKRTFIKEKLSYCYELETNYGADQIITVGKFDGIAKFFAKRYNAIMMGHEIGVNNKSKNKKDLNKIIIH